ncbi:hypothetical protein C5167_030001, partial [Papaver somniferum]
IINTQILVRIILSGRLVLDMCTPDLCEEDTAVQMFDKMSLRVSESVAREHMQHLISSSWEKINTSLSSSQDLEWDSIRTDLEMVMAYQIAKQKIG